MNLLEAAKQALDAMEDVQEMMNTSEWFNDRVTALRQAIEQAEKQEPVAWFEYNPDLEAWFLAYHPNTNPKVKTRPLYTAPPQREWVGLTDEEVSETLTEHHGWQQFAKAIEAKLKEKNAYGWQSVENPSEYLDELRGGKDE
jgi:uncharacterized UPF0160 family protein